MGTPGAPLVVAFQDLWFHYRRGPELFGGLTHEFPPARVTVLTGPSGRGKSTLMYVLGLLLTPSRGHVSLSGANASELPDAARSRLRARHLGFVFQDSELDPTRSIVSSVAEPGLYAGERASDVSPRALALLERFGLSDRAEHRPGQISGGQAQRVALCRAMVNAPDIVLADEPTGNLDPDNAELVVEALQDVARGGCTVIIASHDPTVVACADEVVRL